MGKQLLKLETDELDDFTHGYVEAMLWAESLDNVSLDQFNFDALTQIKKECAEFQKKYAAYLERACQQSGYNQARAGHDLWLTRNGHGCGFWDRSELERVLIDRTPLSDLLTSAAKAEGERNCYSDGEGEDIAVYYD